MIPFLPRPWIWLAVVAAVAGIWGHGNMTGARAERGRHAAIMVEAQAAATRKQMAIVAGIQRASEEAYAAQLEIENRLAGADAAVERLREAVRTANQRVRATADAEPNAAAARSFLAECAGAYRDMAREADRLRAAVIGLQAYVREVTK